MSPIETAGLQPHISQVFLLRLFKNVHLPHGHSAFGLDDWLLFSLLNFPENLRSSKRRFFDAFGVAFELLLFVLEELKKVSMLLEEVD